MKIKIIATPHFKETPRSDLAQMLTCADQHLNECIGGLSVLAIASVRKAGHDMRDDWTIVLSFRSVG